MFHMLLFLVRTYEAILAVRIIIKNRGNSEWIKVLIKQLVYSFVHSFIRSFVHSFIRSLIN